MLLLCNYADAEGGQPPSSLRADSPGVFAARTNRGARFGAPLEKKGKLFPLARPSALRPVPPLDCKSLVVNDWLFFLAKNTLAEGKNLFWREASHGV